MGTAASIAPGTEDSLPKEMIEKAERLFLLLDQDKDGSLQKIEVKHYYKKILAMKDQAAYRAEVARMLKIFQTHQSEGDSSGTTQVNMRQFILGITAEHNSDPANAAETLDSAIAAFKKYHKKRAKAKNDKRKKRRLKRLREEVKVGTRLEVRKGKVWRTATVKAINDDDTYDVEVLSDGSAEKVKMSKCRLPKEEVKATVNLTLDVPPQSMATTVSSVAVSPKSADQSTEALETSAVTPDDLPDEKVTESKSPEPEKESKSDDAADQPSVSPEAIAFTVTKAVALFVGGPDSDDEDEEVCHAVVEDDAKAADTADTAAAGAVEAEATATTPTVTTTTATPVAAPGAKVPAQIQRVASFAPQPGLNTTFAPVPKVAPVRRDGGIVGQSNLLKPMNHTKLTPDLQKLVDQRVITKDQAIIMMHGTDTEDEKAGKDEWQCQFCTYINDARNPFQCEVCNGKRSQDTKLPEPKDRAALRNAKPALVASQTVMVPKGGEGKLLQLNIGGNATQVRAPPGVKAGEKFKVKVSAPAPAPVSQVRLINLKLRVPPGGSGKLLQVVVDGVKVRARAPPGLKPGETFMVQVSWPKASEKKAKTSSVQVIVPPNALPGSRVLIQTKNGQKAWVTIPSGAKPGQRIMVQL